MIDEKKLIERFKRLMGADSLANMFIKDVIKEIRKQPKIGEWIPCTARMPEEHDSIFAKFKGTDKWNDAMFEKISNSVNVTVADNKGQNTTTHAHTIDGQWSCDLLKCNKDYRIVAWQPLPEPYQPKGE